MNLDTNRYLTGCAAAAGSSAQELVRRIAIELEFATAFALQQEGNVRSTWQAIIDQAEALASQFSGGDAAAFVALAEGVEALLAPIGMAAKAYEIVCVGHGHIDMNWMWSWPETASATHDTFASVLHLMRQFPQVTYSQSQASVYALVEKYYPEMFEEIKQRVKEGRWEITAVHWVEGDKNLSSGESIIRHMLYTRAYIQEKFGLNPEDVPVDWEPDTFGHASTIPMIVSAGAARYYYSCRQGGGFEHAVSGTAAPRPMVFWWEAPNGARLLVNRESTWYNSYVNIGDNIAMPMLTFSAETGLRRWMNIYGIGNHGGGPTRKEVEYLHWLQQLPIYPAISFGTATEYFRYVEAQDKSGAVALPVLKHELNYEFTGCYTSQSAIKRGNRWGENYLEEAETLALLGERLGGIKADRVQLRDAWINVLFNQFHDILPGSGVRETREHAQALFQETGAIKRRVTKALAAHIDTVSLLPDTHLGRAERALAKTGAANTPFEAGAGIGAMETGYSQSAGGGKHFRPFAVYNPSPFVRSERVTVALFDTEFDAGRIAVIDDRGEAHPVMVLSKGNDWGHQKLVVAFDAIDVPAIGYRTYLFCETEAEAKHPTVSLSRDEWIETPYFRIKLDRFRAGIAALIDRRTGENLVPEGAILGAWQFVTERPRGMTAWVLGQELDPPQTLQASGFGLHGVTRNEGTAAPIGGPVMGYRAEWRLEVPGTQSRVRLSLMIHALEPRLDFTAELDWREIGDEKRGIPGLTVSFPTSLKHVKATYEVPFGSIERDLNGGEEVPSLRYAHLSGSYGDGEWGGVSLLQDSKYGYALHGSELRMRVVRSSFDPDHAPEVAKSTMRYSVYLHAGKPTPTQLAELGAACNHPLLPIPVPMQHGEAPASGGFVENLSTDVAITALKLPENGSGILIRLNELNGSDAVATIRFDPSLSAALTRAELTDVLERPVQSMSGAAQFDGVLLTVPVPANSLVTVRLT